MLLRGSDRLRFLRHGRWGLGGAFHGAPVYMNCGGRERCQISCASPKAEHVLHPEYKCRRGVTSPNLKASVRCSLGGDMHSKFVVWGVRLTVLATLMAALGWMLVDAATHAGAAPVAAAQESQQQSATPSEATNSKPAANIKSAKFQGDAKAALSDAAAPGSLEILGKDGKSAGLCPLKHTDVSAELSGFLARVTVLQQFWNPSSDKIEAVYVFPLPQNSAVDDMTLHVAERTVRGLIKKREEAQQIYQQAKQQGHVAALLDQE